jgi:hypothetical protein
MLIAATLPIVRKSLNGTSGRSTGSRYAAIIVPSTSTWAPSGRNEDFIFDAVYQDGRLVRVRMLRYTINKAVASQSQTQSVMRSYEHPKPGDVFEAPWDPRYAQQYRISLRSRRTIAFQAIDTSYGHGNRSFTINRDDDVTSYTYEPTVLPQHATSGRVTGERSAVLPGYWAMTQEHQTYGGHYAIFSGNATVSFSRSHCPQFVQRLSNDLR